MTARLMSMAEAAERLDIDRKTLLEYVRTGAITYVLLGKRRKFADQDLEAFIARRRVREEPCPSIDRQNRRTGNMISNIVVGDFMARRALRLAAKRKK